MEPSSGDAQDRIAEPRPDSAPEAHKRAPEGGRHEEEDMIRIGKPIAALAAAVATAIAATAIAATAASAPAATDACAAYQPQVPDPSRFVDVIDNPYFPLPVGRTLVYRGVSDGERQVDRLQVTDKTKVIAGISATVVHDVVFTEGKKDEITFDWYAQDDAGNVWYLGEDTKVLLGNGKVDRSGSWETGVNGAKPGLIMEADPQAPDAYRQECLSGEAEDTAWVISRGGSLTVPIGTVHQVLRTLEFARIEPNVVSQKQYAPGLGIVVEQDLHGGNEHFELVKVTG
jgi:hypothetical protein